MNKLFASRFLNALGLTRATCIAEAFDDLLTEISKYCPESREFSIAKTKLEEAAFFAKKAMASDPENQA